MLNQSALSIPKLNHDDEGEPPWDQTTDLQGDHTPMPVERVLPRQLAPVVAALWVRPCR